MSNMLQSLNISSAEYQPTNYDALPKGNYLVLITKSEEKVGRTSNKPYLSLTLEVLEGEYKGRKIFVNLNLFSDNPEALRIARNDMAGICYATGVVNLVDINDVLQKPFMAKVDVKSKDNGEKYNTVKEYMPATGTIGNAQVATPKKPWER